MSDGNAASPKAIAWRRRTALRALRNIGASPRPATTINHTATTSDAGARLGRIKVANPRVHPATTVGTARRQGMPPARPSTRPSQRRRSSAESLERVEPASSQPSGAAAPLHEPTRRRPTTNDSQTKSAPARGVTKKMASRPATSRNGASSAEKPGAQIGDAAPGDG